MAKISNFDLGIVLLLWGGTSYAVSLRTVLRHMKVATSLALRHFASLQSKGDSQRNTILG